MATRRVKGSGQQDRLRIPFFLGWHDECIMRRICDQQGNVLGIASESISPSQRYPEITVKDYLLANTVIAEKTHKLRLIGGRRFTLGVKRSSGYFCQAADGFT